MNRTIEANPGTCKQEKRRLKHVSLVTLGKIPGNPPKPKNLPIKI